VCYTHISCWRACMQLVRCRCWSIDELAYGGYRLDYRANRVPTYMHDRCPPPHANVPDGSAVLVLAASAFRSSKSGLQLMSKLLNQLGHVVQVHSLSFSRCARAGAGFRIGVACAIFFGPRWSLPPVAACVRAPLAKLSSCFSQALLALVLAGDACMSSAIILLDHVY
jgi:hypothetical protein